MKKLTTLFLFTFLLIGSVSLSAQLVDVVTGLSTPQGLAIDDNELYIGLQNTNVKKIDINQSFPPAVIDVTPTNQTGSTGITLVGSDLYIFGGGELKKININDPLPATPTSIISSGLGISGPIASIGDELFLADWQQNKIKKINISNPNPQLIDVISTSVPFGLASKGNELFIAEFGAGRIIKFDITDPNPVAIEVVTGLSQPSGLTINGNFLYIAQAGKLVRIDTNEPNPTIEDVVIGLSSPRLSAFNGLDIYISESNLGKVVKFSVDAPVLSMLSPVCSNTMPSNLGGASPTGGVYSGIGVTDNGNGETFSFDPAAAGGLGTYTITYTLGQAVTTTLEVVASPSVTFTASTDIQIDAGIQMNLSGGSPAGGTYSGTGVMDNGDGTYNFDPMVAGIGMHSITYTFTDANGCGGSATDDIAVNSASPPGDDCMQANDINNLFGAPVGEAQTSQLWDNTNATGGASDPTTGLDCFYESNLTNTIWYTFTGDGNAYTIKTLNCNATNPVPDEDLQGTIFTGDCGTLTEVACNENESGQVGVSPLNFGLDFDTENGVIYHLMIDATYSNSNFNGIGEFCLEVTKIGIAGDDCMEANDINNLFGAPAGEAQTSQLWDNTDATSAATDPTTGLECFFESDLNNTIWYTFTGDGNSYTIKTLNCNATNPVPGEDLQGAIFTGDCGTLTEVACNEDEDFDNDLYNSNFDFDTEDGVIYYLMLDGTTSSIGNGTGEFCIEVTQRMPNAVTSINQTNIEIFPNPTTGDLQIQNIQADLIEVFDNTGQLVKTINQAGNRIDITELPTGFYFLKIFEGEEVYSAKVVKE